MFSLGKTAPALFFTICLEESGLCEFGRNSLQCSLHEITAHLLLVIDVKSDITAGVGNCYAGDNSVTAGNLSDGGHVCNVSGRNAALFKLFYHRCSATGAASSSGDEDCSIDTLAQQLFADFSAHAACFLQRGKVAGGGVENIVQLAESAFSMELLEF